MYRYIDLFCGIGGFRTALEKEGLECVFSSDIDSHVKEAYFKNFNDKPDGDITEIPEKYIPAHDVLCAGFPCQPFSISGKHKGISDDRGRLFYEIIRIAEYHQPYILLLENVKNILSIDNGNVIKTIDSKLSEIGYDVQRHVLNASHFGIPQARERVYFVCLRKDIKNSGKLKYKQPKTLLKSIYLENLLENDVSEKLFINRDDIVINRIPSKTENQLKPIRVGTINKGGQGERIYSVKGHAVTLSAYGGGAGARTGLYLINDRVRRLSVTECKRIMGYSDKHYVSNGIQGERQLGNSIIPSMVSKVWNSIKAA